MTAHSGPLVTFERHPVQYHAPVYRALGADFGVPVTAVYGSDLSITGYHDVEFDRHFAWDVDLLSGYSSRFISRVSEGGPGSAEDVRGTRAIHDALNELRPSAVLIHGYASKFDRYALRAALRAKVPILFRGETTDHAVKRSRAKSAARDMALRLLYKRLAAMLYVGTRSRDHYARLGVPARKLRFSPYCVDAASFRCTDEDRNRLRDEARASMAVSDDRFMILFSGKISARKGVDLLVPAIRRCPQELRERIVLAFVGGGDRIEAIQKAAATNPPIDTRFVGFLNQTELSPIYHAADLLVLPSLQSETWGLVVNEALLHGLPCVLSESVGCVSDLVVPGKTGAACPAGSEEALATALQQGFELAGRDDIRTACRESVADFSVDKAAEGVLAALSDVV